MLAFLLKRLEDAQAPARRLFGMLEKVGVEVPGGSVGVSASCGIAVGYCAARGASQRLLEAADQALLQVKRSGKGRYDVVRVA